MLAHGDTGPETQICCPILVRGLRHSCSSGKPVNIKHKREEKNSMFVQITVCKRRLAILLWCLGFRKEFKKNRSNYTRDTVFLPCPVEVVHPAKQGDTYVMPLSEHTGSHSDVEQEQFWLHWDIRERSSLDVSGVLGRNSEIGDCFQIWNTVAIYSGWEPMFTYNSGSQLCFQPIGCIRNR